MNAREQKFVTTVYTYYSEHGRHTLPWRKTHAPYRIVIAEIMLQQTQVERVIPKYKQFLKLFPSVQALAAAPLGEVLVAWQGLGYNRRAKMLHSCAQVLVTTLKGKWPLTHAGLVALPGIGPYTASAILAFAFNIPTPLIETNVRTVYLHHFFPWENDVPDSALLPIIERTLDQKDPRSWYAALMDYGTHLKATVGNKSRASKHHTSQSTFAGSDREIRGAIVRLLSQLTALSIKEIKKKLDQFEGARIETQLVKLQSEGMVQKLGTTFSLPK